MATIAKPTNKAFVVDPEKTDVFLTQKNSSAKKTLERFYAHQPAKDTTTPYKGKRV
ncbi:MAG: hypothetical protein IIW15_03615 [Firmicutes bacterium]|nr:hypothetical protein [Bacillota bacterium]